jgi:hypothetical protein
LRRLTTPFSGTSASNERHWRAPIGRAGPAAQRLTNETDSDSGRYASFSLVRQEVTIAEAAASQPVDRSTILRIRTVAKQGALAALAASKPGVAASARDVELERAKTDIAEEWIFSVCQTRYSVRREPQPIICGVLARNRCSRKARGDQESLTDEGALRVPAPAVQLGWKVVFETRWVTRADPARMCPVLCAVYDLPGIPCLCSVVWVSAGSHPDEVGVDVVMLDLRSDRNDG